MTAIIFDSETNDRENPEIVEAAWIFVEFGNPTSGQKETVIDEEGYEIVSERAHLVRLKPSRPITLGAMSTHHITDDMVADEDPSSMFELPECDFLIGHNVDFDWGAAGKPAGPKRICTLALARAVWPDLDCHTQSALIYHLDRENARQRTREAHGAVNDVWLCKTILDAEIAALGVQSWQELWERSEKARIPDKMPFGKHKGELIKNIPSDYKRWLLSQPDVDDYLRIALGGQPKEKTLFMPA